MKERNGASRAHIQIKRYRTDTQRESKYKKQSIHTYHINLLHLIPGKERLKKRKLDDITRIIRKKKRGKTHTKKKIYSKYK